MVRIYITGRLFAYCGYGETLPLVAICTTWRADQLLYSSCTLGIYSDVNCNHTRTCRSLPDAEFRIVFRGTFLVEKAFVKKIPKNISMHYFDYRLEKIIRMSQLTCVHMKTANCSHTRE